MSDLAIDALTTTISPAAIKAAGYVAVLNYLRNVTAQVVAGYHAVGLGFGSIFETAANESLDGATQGSADGQTAAAQMRALGQAPGTVHVVNLADFAPTPAQLPTIRAYWQAYLAQTSAWHVVPYGPGWLLQAMNTAGWQNAMDDNGQPGSTIVPQAVLYQRVAPTLTIPGASYDEDVILAPLPWWGLAAPNPAPAPSPAPQPQHPTLKENEMALANDGHGQYIITADSTGRLRKNGLPFGTNVQAIAAAGTPNWGDQAALLATLPNAG